MSDQTTQTPPSNPGLDRGSWPGLTPEARFPGTEGRYIIKAILGTGGQGIVYLAVDRSLNQHVAIKILRPERFNAEATRQFEIEAQNQLAMPIRPELLRVLDWGVGDDRGWFVPFLVMEYRAGAKPLQQFVKLNNLSRRERLRLWTRVAQAAEHLHDENLIHRDLKPGNILVTPDGQPIIIDFGLALSPKTYVQRLNLPTELGGLFGTVGYMSPEQAAKEDSTAIAASTDVYALGIIGYELLLDRDPYSTPVPQRRGFNGRPTEQFLDEIREARVTDPLRHDPTLHPSVARILRRALARRSDPSGRYQHAGALAAALRHQRNQHGWREAALGLVAFLPAWLLAASLAWSIAAGWTPLNSAFQRAMLALAPSEPLDHVLIVDLARAEDQRLDQAAAKLGLPDTVGGSPGRSVRPLIAKLAERAVAGGAAAVGIDVLLDTKADTLDADQLTADILGDKSGPLDRTVFAIRQWHDPDIAPSRISMVAPIHALNPRIGPPMIREGDGITMHAEIAFEAPNGPVQPSFALLLALTSQRGGPQPPLTINATLGSIDAHFAESTLASPITAIDIADQTPPAYIEGMNPPKGTYAILAFTVPDDAELKRRTIQSFDLLDMDTRALANQVNGRVVLIGRIDDPADLFTDPHGRVLPGIVANAAAIESLLDRRAIRWATLTQEQAAAAGASALAVLYAALRRGRRDRVLVPAAAAGVLIPGACLLLFAHQGLALMPFSAVICTLGTLAGFVGLDRAVARWW